MLWLKEDTAADIKVGPFVDSTDGNTTETGLTITQPDIMLSKNGGTFAQKSAAQTLSHDTLGWYTCNLSTTDTNTAGTLIVAIHESGALPVWHEFMVLPANVFDSLSTGSDTLDVQVTGMGAGVVTAAAIATDAIDNDAIAANAVTEIQSGLALATDLATVDTVVDAIKVKTDSLTFTTAGEVDANIHSVNDVAVNGTGTGGDPWGP